MKKKIVWASVALPLSLAFCSLPSLAADATSFDPTKVQITAKATSSIPVGTVVTWPSGANPADMQNADGTYNWLECNGQSISQTVYPELFAVIGAKVPDYRGLFLRGYGQQSHTQNNGSAVGVTSTTHVSGELGKVQGDAIRDPGSSSVTYLHSGSGGMSCEGPMCDGFKTVQTRGDQWAGSWPMNSPGLNPLKGLQQPFGNEIRPVNTAVRYFIRARP
ncbi:MAG TPA: phage tail protein [Candidatus Desulfovibrio intestinigallinarum]|nr:phage tail protein [Candidatus Desulfovibrio intestinigallinarum]